MDSIVVIPVIGYFVGHFKHLARLLLSLAEPPSVQ